MIKKKKTDQDGEMEKEKSEKADNNENIEVQDIAGEKTDNDNITLEDKAEPSSGSESPERAPDNVVAPGKTSEEKLAEMHDKYLRLSAEFDNYRKRTLREKIELTKFAGENLLIKILPVMDDFERALSHMDITTDRDAMKSGIDLIYSKFADFLKQNGVREIESLNLAFNVDIHDAVAKVTVEEEDRKGKVVEVIQKGYYLQDKILRHAKVVVGE
jgi:molecular chaperone GrpE